MVVKFRMSNFYKDEDGKFIATEEFLLKRGFCCKNGCKHCPYGYKKQ